MNEKIKINDQMFNAPTLIIGPTQSHEGDEREREETMTNLRPRKC